MGIGNMIILTKKRIWACKGQRTYEYLNYLNRS